MTFTLGIDESGTGAWAGPFYVCGVLVGDEAQFSANCGGLLNDSKKLSDAKRRALVPLIARHALVTFSFIGSVEMIRQMGMRVVWRQGVVHIASQSTTRFHLVPQEIVIDGPRDRHVHDLLPKGVSVTWEPKADAKYPSVMAASILAKTFRNNDMNTLAEKFPGYDWENNAGYGAKKHREGIDKLGLTPEHRPISTFQNSNVLDILSGKE